MGLYHEFLVLPKQQFCVNPKIIDYYMNNPEEAYKHQHPIGSLKAQAYQIETILRQFYLQNRTIATAIHDDYIRDRLIQFSVITTLHNGYIPLPGLNYYSFSVICPDGIPRFIKILESFSCEESQETIRLSRVAVQNGHYLLHRGI